MRYYDDTVIDLIFAEAEAQGRRYGWLAGELHVVQPRLSDWKARRRKMPVEMIEQAARVLGISDNVLALFLVTPIGAITTPTGDKVPVHD